MDAEGATDPRPTWIWIAVGCGGLALSALCLAPPIVWLAGDDDAEEVATPPPLDPALEPAPPAPAPSPPPMNPLLPPPPPTGATRPRHVTVIVEQVTGSIAARAGSQCSFGVAREDRADGTFWCNAQIACAGQLLYGGSGAGYFDCTLYEQPQRHVVGEDPSTTGGDGDAAMRLDTLRGSLTVRDDATGRHGAFSLRGRVTSVQ